MSHEYIELCKLIDRIQGKSLDIVVSQRDELLGALRTIAYEPIGRSDATHAEVLDHIVDIAKAAIARAEGQSSTEVAS